MTHWTNPKLSMYINLNVLGLLNICSHIHIHINSKEMAFGIQ